MADPVAEDIEFLGPDTPKASPVRSMFIEVREKLTDEWEEIPFPRLDFAIWACAPTMPRAQFTVTYGQGILPDEAYYHYIAPLRLSRFWVRISLPYDNYTDDDGEWRWRWHGVVDVTSDVQNANALVDDFEYVPTGERTFMAYGLESLLDRLRIERSKFRKPGSGSEVLEAKVGITFNEGGRGNRSKTKVGFSDDYYVFEHHASEKDAIENTWSTRDIVEYLLHSGVAVPEHRISDEDDDIWQMRWVLSDENRDRLPDWDAPELETHLSSALDVLNTLVSRRRLLTWWVEMNTVNIVEVKIKTMTDAEIELPGEKPGATESEPAVILPNLDWINLRFDRHVSADVVYQSDTVHSVDQVICYGARRTNTFTADFGTSTGDHFKRGWTVAEQQKYELGGSDHPSYPPDAEVALRQEWHSWARSREEVAHVFKRFQLNELLAYPPNDPDDYRQFFGSVRLLPSIPLKEVTDYSGYHVSDKTVDLSKLTNVLDTRPPIVLIQVPLQSGSYVDVAKMGRGGQVEAVDEIDVRDWAAVIRVPKDGQSLTVDVTRGPQYTIAYGDFKPREEDEIVHGHWQWETMRATVAIADDRYCESRYPADDDIPDFKEIVRTMRIPCGANYKLDWIAKDTIVDLDPQGSPVTVSAAGFINDDRARLENIARMAYGWYSQERSAIRIRWPWDAPVEKIKLGHFVRTLQQGLIAHEVFSTITEIEIQVMNAIQETPRNDLPPMQVTIHTAFGELDFLRLHAHGAKRARRFREASKK
ncbi:MAG: hypothetical protein E6Q97_37080 [Desulfurellales bacterium]|nr:MAG: hypothetical protein E6Q97_37080 [Desulfurellales bacterium]